MEPLRVIDHVAFEAPAGLEDATRWVFGDPARAEALTVELEAPAGRATPALTVITALRERLAAVAPAAEILDEGDTVLDGRRAWYLAYAMEGVGEPAVGMVVAANRPGGDHVVLSLRVPEREALGPMFGPVLASVSLRGAPAPVPAGPGHRREHVGPVALDVPLPLAGPRSHLFVDADDRMRLRLTVRSPDEPPFDLDAALAREAARGELRERREQAWSWGRWVRAVRRAAEPPHREQVVVWASLTVPLREATADRPAEVRHVEIHGVAVPERAEDLDVEFDALLASVRAQPTGGPAS